MSTQLAPEGLKSLFSLNARPDDDWPELAPEALSGLAGEVVGSLAPYSEADPAAILVNLLVGFGAAVGRGPHFMVGATRHGANLSAVLVGQSGKARKGDSWAPVYRVLRRADGEFAERVLQGLSTGEGLIAAVGDAVTRMNRDGEQVVVEEGVSDKRLLAIAPEFARVLGVMGRDGNTLSAVLREAWDGGDLRVMTKSPRVASEPHVAMLGHVTSQELARALTTTDAANGFANRVLWVAVRRSRLLPDPPVLTDEAVAELAAPVAIALNRARRVGLVRRDEGASALWRELYPDLSADRPGLAGAVLGRHEAQAVRLSLVYALLDGSAVVTCDHLQAAVAVLDLVEASAAMLFGQRLGDPVADDVLELLRERGEMTRSSLRDGLGHHVSSERLGGALAALQALGLVQARREETAGRPREIWGAKREKRDIRGEGA